MAFAPANVYRVPPVPPTRLFSVIYSVCDSEFKRTVEAEIRENSDVGVVPSASANVHRVSPVPSFDVAHNFSGNYTPQQTRTTTQRIQDRSHRSNQRSEDHYSITTGGADIAQLVCDESNANVRTVLPFLLPHEPIPEVNVLGLYQQEQEDRIRKFTTKPTGCGWYLQCKYSFSSTPFDYLHYVRTFYATCFTSDRKTHLSTWNIQERRNGIR